MPHVPVLLMAARVVWLLTGIAWATRSLLEFASPEYYEPVTPLDWSAVVVYSAAWLSSASAVALLARSIRSFAVTAVAVVFVVAATMAGVANAIEDAFAQSWGGTPYVVGFIVGWLSLIPLVALLRRTGHGRLASLPLALFASIASFVIGGGLIVLTVATTYAVAPRWFGAKRLAEGQA